MEWQIQVKAGLDSGLFPESTKPLHEPILSFHKWKEHSKMKLGNSFIKYGEFKKRLREKYILAMNN